MLTPGTYEIIGLIGRGGMAEVYRARIQRPGGFSKEFAIKRIHGAGGMNVELTRRFEEEAKLTSILEHPNIIQVHDFIPSGDAYLIVMEYVHGRDLRSILAAANSKGIKIPLELSVHIMFEVCKGLDYAHRKRDPRTGEPLNIIHRDLTPGNIMVSFEGIVKVVDFGIAKTKLNRITQTGKTIGTIGYFSPEQFAGEQLDHRSDVYSASVVLWELVAQTGLFEGETVAEVLRNMQSSAIRRPSEVNPAVPPALETIILKGLQKNRADRYWGMSAMMEDLETFMKNEPPCSQRDCALFLSQLFGEKITMRSDPGMEESRLDSGEVREVLDGLRRMDLQLRGLSGLESKLESPDEASLSSDLPPVRTSAVLQGYHLERGARWKRFTAWPFRLGSAIVLLAAINFAGWWLFGRGPWKSQTIPRAGEFTEPGPPLFGFLQAWSKEGHLGIASFFPASPGALPLDPWVNPGVGLSVGQTRWLAGTANDSSKKTMSTLVQWKLVGDRVELTQYAKAPRDGSYREIWSGTVARLQRGRPLRQFLGDVDGDGSDDLVELWESGGTLTFAVFFAAAGGTSFDLARGWYSPPAPAHASSAIDFFLTDADGDGRADIVRLRDNQGKLAIETFRSTGDGFATPQSPGAGSCSFSADAIALAMGDVDGDGRADIIRVWDDGGKLAFTVVPSNGSGYDCSKGRHTTGHPFLGSAAIGILTGDVDGDGKTDIIQCHSNGALLGIQVFYSDGQGYSASSSTSSPGCQWIGLGAMSYLTGDVDGDGKTDLVQVWDEAGKTRQAVFPSRAGFRACDNWSASRPAESASRGSEFIPIDLDLSIKSKLALGSRRVVNPKLDGIYRPRLGVDSGPLIAASATDAAKGIDRLHSLGVTAFRTELLSGEAVSHTIAVVRRASELGMTPVIVASPRQEDLFPTARAPNGVVYRGNSTFRRLCGHDRGAIALSAVDPKRFAARVRSFLDKVRTGNLWLAALQVGSELDVVCGNGDLPLRGPVPVATIDRTIASYAEILKESHGIIRGHPFFDPLRILTHGYSDAFLRDNPPAAFISPKDWFGRLACIGGQSRGCSGEQDYVSKYSNAVAVHLSPRSGDDPLLEKALGEVVSSLRAPMPVWVTSWGTSRFPRAADERFDELKKFLGRLSSFDNVRVEHAFLSGLDLSLDSKPRHPASAGSRSPDTAIFHYSGASTAK